MDRPLRRRRVSPTARRHDVEHSSYVPEGSPTLRLVIFVPYDEAERREKLRALLPQLMPLSRASRRDNRNRTSEEPRATRAASVRRPITEPGVSTDCASHERNAFGAAMV